jgi:hypothetical protein
MEMAHLYQNVAKYLGYASFAIYGDTLNHKVLPGQLVNQLLVISSSFRMDMFRSDNFIV